MLSFRKSNKEIQFSKVIMRSLYEGVRWTVNEFGDYVSVKRFSFTSLGFMFASIPSALHLLGSELHLSHSQLHLLIKQFAYLASCFFLLSDFSEMKHKNAILSMIIKKNHLSNSPFYDHPLLL